MLELTVLKIRETECFIMRKAQNVAGRSYAKAYWFPVKGIKSLNNCILYNHVSIIPCFLLSPGRPKAEQNIMPACSQAAWELGLSRSLQCPLDGKALEQQR